MFRPISIPESDFATPGFKDRGRRRRYVEGGNCKRKEKESDKDAMVNWEAGNGGKKREY